MDGRNNIIENRFAMALIGMLSGACLWFLIDVLPDTETGDRALLAVIAAGSAFFAVLLGTLGPLGLGAASMVAAAVAAPAAVLISWAGLRYDDVGDFLSGGEPGFAWIMLVALPVPFLIAAARKDERWSDYAALFTHSWQIVVRYGAAWVFAGVFWGLLFLSDQVLKIVGIDLIERIVDIDQMPWLLTGAMLGLGLAVVHELGDYVSPYLLLRLLRLLLPLVLGVTVVFLIAAPMRGLSDLFGGLSAAGTLMAMALIAVTLVTTALDQDRAHQTASPLLIWSSRVMAMLIPALGGLAAWAVWLRVAQYGWTPARFWAAIAAAVTVAYGLGYLAAALRGGDWMARLRQVNVVMALAFIAVCGLTLTPVLNAERMSVNSQIARFERGEVALADLDLWELGREWGRAGQAGLARLAAMNHPEQEALDAALARLDEAETRRDLVVVEREETLETTRRALLDILPVRPTGAALPDYAFEDDIRVKEWLDGCGYRTPMGAPACVAILGDFMPLVPGDEAVVVYMTSTNRITARAWVDGSRETIVDFAGTSYQMPEDTIDRILADDFTFAPAPLTVLELGDTILGIGP